MSEIKLTEYKPFDGDYIDEDYTGLMNAIQTEQGAAFGAYLEIMVDLTDDETIEISFSDNDGEEWAHTYFYPIPPGWTIERLRPMFAGHGVYLDTDEFQQQRVEYIPCWIDEFKNLRRGFSEDTLEACEKQLQERNNFGHNDIKHEIRRVQTTIVKSYWLKGKN